MGLRDPIDELVTSEPTPALITVRAAPGGYDPDANYDPLGGGTVPGAWIYGFYSSAIEATADFQATMTFRARDYPGGVELGQTQVQTVERQYTIVRQRERRHEGVLNGYTVELRAA